MFSAAGYFFRPGVPEPNYESVSRYLATNPDDPIYVWGSVPEIYWASGRRPATRFLTSSFLTGNYPGRPADQANTGDDTEQAWNDFYADFTAHPPKYFVDTSPAKVRGAQYYPISEVPAPRAHHQPAVPLRALHRPHRGLPPQVIPSFWRQRGCVIRCVLTPKR